MSRPKLLGKKRRNSREFEGERLRLRVKRLKGKSRLSQACKLDLDRRRYRLVIPVVKYPITKVKVSRIRDVIRNLI